MGAGRHRLWEAFRQRAFGASDESGQILSITAVSMGLLLVCVGLVVDVGHAMLVQRQLQAGVDAAALAGVQHLPDKLAAESVAMQYSATPGSKNAVNTVDNATTTAKAVCITGVPGCNRRDGGVNGVVVDSTSKVPTWFGKIIGINHLTVSARASACSPCIVKPLDIMIVLDRTGSMCQFAPNSWDVNCGDLRNARLGIEEFLTHLDPTIDKVGLALTPPALMDSYRTVCPDQGYGGGDGPSRPGYKPWNGTTNPNVPVGHTQRGWNGRYYGYDAWYPRWDLAESRGATPSWYVVAGLEGADGNTADDYLVQDPVDGSWDLNYSQSAVLQRLGCTSGAGSTSYALSIEEAQHELMTTGRGGVQDVIIFLSDGAANTSPQQIPSTHWSRSLRNRPCAAGVQAAQNAKDAGIILYTIGYDLDAGSGAPERCRRPDSNGHNNGSNPVETGYDAYTAIQAMASRDAAGQPLFYNKPDAGDLTAIFEAIAKDIAGSKSRLIDSTRPTLT